IDSQVITLPEHPTESELLEMIDQQNNYSSVHAILVQLPLPAHINKNNVIYRIKPDKEVDGFHHTQGGRLQLRAKIC
ncbi:tetrahydrofolate dehydrogenase/cyclohydrolase catalytic domain-containing protein, partial [Francisella tularensis]|uniref:tetrahydrofolate dehydrogenase/cyclohydrolase catalytic domain-containing protein n=1 Tax=Francisella tularensis TaxID=263 RepID=UPI002381CF03